MMVTVKTEKGAKAYHAKTKATCWKRDLALQRKISPPKKYPKHQRLSISSSSWNWYTKDTSLHISIFAATRENVFWMPFLSFSIMACTALCARWLFVFVGLLNGNPAGKSTANTQESAEFRKKEEDLSPVEMIATTVGASKKRKMEKTTHYDVCSDGSFVK